MDYQELVCKIQSSRENHERVIQAYERTQRMLKQQRDNYLRALYEWLHTKLGMERSSFIQMTRVYYRRGSESIRIANSDAGDSYMWLQELLLIGTSETTAQELPAFRRFISGNYQDFQQLDCACSFVFESWEGIIDVELVQVPGCVVTESYRGFRKRRDTWVNVRRWRTYQEPDRAKLRFVLRPVPDISEIFI